MNDVPLVLFGAFDRHNLGDLLLGHLAQRRAGPRPCLFAGLKGADWRAEGGFRVIPLADLVAEWPHRWGDAPLELHHVGGEILDTDAWEAAVMLQSPSAAARTVAALDGQPAAAMAWAGEFLGGGRQAPYLVGHRELPPGSRVLAHAVGGVGLAGRPAAFQAEVLAALAEQARVTVRDRVTGAFLARHGLAVTLAPDPVAAYGGLLAADISSRMPGEPSGYLAVQFAAALADDATLDALAEALNTRGWPVVLFRAGAAPWHDDLAAYERLAVRLRVPVRIEHSLNIWTLVGLISGARGCVASSLHGLLVAGLAGLPAHGLERRDGEGAKLRAYADTWGGFSVGTARRLAKDFRSQQAL